jgi:hypothetical protein
MWVCQACCHENDDDGSTFCEKCGALREEDTTDSLDNKDSEDLFFDDEGV